MYEEPVHIPDPGGPKPADDTGVAAPALMHGMQQMYSMTPDPARLKLSSQRVILHNTDPRQTHIMFDRWKNGIVLLPGQKREVEMAVDELAELRSKGRANRGVYMSGPKIGQPLPPHPVQIIDIPDEPVRDNRDPEEPVSMSAAPGFEPGPVELGPAAGDVMHNVVTTPAEPTSPAESSKIEPTFEIRRIPVTAILADPSIQQREGGTSAHVVEEYVEAMRGGDEFPPIVVFSNDGVQYHLADGFHRLGASRLVQREEIECEIHAGDWEDALLFACGANSDHGLRRTCSDQRKAVSCLLRHPKWSARSDREIARVCKVSHTLVGKVRRQHLETPFTDAGQPVNTVAPDRRRIVQRGGKRYGMKTAGIGKTTPRSKKARPAPTLNSRSWSRSTPQARKAFVREVGPHEIEAVIDAVEPSRALRRFESIEQAWNGATDPERLAFARKHHDEIKTLGWQQGWR
jgi:hypothetical protein